MTHQSGCVNNANSRMQRERGNTGSQSTRMNCFRKSISGMKLKINGVPILRTRTKGDTFKKTRKELKKTVKVCKMAWLNYIAKHVPDTHMLNMYGGDTWKGSNRGNSDRHQPTPKVSHPIKAKRQTWKKSQRMTRKLATSLQNSYRSLQLQCHASKH